MTTSIAEQLEEMSLADVQRELRQLRKRVRLLEAVEIGLQATTELEDPTGPQPGPSIERDAEQDWSDLGDASEAGTPELDSEPESAPPPAKAPPAKAGRPRNPPINSEEVIARLVTYLRHAGPTSIKLLAKELQVDGLKIGNLVRNDNRFVKASHGVYGLRR